MPNKKSQKRGKPTQRRSPAMSKAVAVFGGSMSVARNPAKERNQTKRRSFTIQSFTNKQSSNVLSSTESPFTVGSQYQSNHVTIKATQFSTEAQNWIRQHDRYRIKSCELFVTSYVKNRDGQVGALGTFPIHHYSFCDSDTSLAQTGGTTPWINVTTRNNIARTVLRSNNPSILVAKWNPRLLYDPTTGNSPSNVVPRAGMWIDAITLDQEHSGVRLYSAAPFELDTQFGFYGLSYEIRAVVEVQAPL